MELKLETTCLEEVSRALVLLDIPKERAQEVLDIILKVQQDAFRTICSVKNTALYVHSGVLRVLNDMVVELEGKETDLKSDSPCFVIKPEEQTEKKSWHYVHPMSARRRNHPQIL